MYNLSEEKSGLGWMCKYSKFGNFAREDMSKVAWPVREGTSIQTSNVVRLVSFFRFLSISVLEFSLSISMVSCSRLVRFLIKSYSCKYRDGKERDFKFFNFSIFSSPIKSVERSVITSFSKFWHCSILLISNSLPNHTSICKVFKFENSLMPLYLVLAYILKLLPFQDL